MFAKPMVVLTLSLCVFVAAQQQKPCLKIDENPDPTEDAKKLCKEVQKGDGWFSDGGDITSILCHRNFSQRNQTAIAFPKECEKRNLLDKLKKVKQFIGKMENLIEVLLSYPSQIYSTIIQNIATGQADDNGSVTFIVCSLNNQEKADLLKVFPTAETVLTDYGLKQGEDYKKVLLETCLKQRNDKPDPNVTPQIVETEARDLDAKCDAEFVQAVKTIFTKYSDADLKNIFVKYSEIKQNAVDIADKILEKFPPKENDAYATLARSIQNIHLFYAKLLRHFVKGRLPNGQFEGINYVIAIRTEIDLFDIADAYHHLDNESFLEDLKETFSPDWVYYNAIKKLFGDCAGD